MKNPLVLSDFGEYLGTRSQNLAVFKNRELKREIPARQVCSVLLFDGNSVSTDALSLCAIDEVSVMVLSRNGKLMSCTVPFNENGNAHLQTRLAQYRSTENGKAKKIAKSLLSAKIQSQKIFLESKGLETDKHKCALNKILRIPETLDYEQFRTHLMTIEAKTSKIYFQKYIALFPRAFQPQKREKYKANHKLNNLLNFAYSFLANEVFKASLISHLDTHFGFLHSEQYLKPSLVCDLEEPFRTLIDRFVLEYITNLDPETSFHDIGNRVFLTPKEAQKFASELNKTFENKIDHRRIKNFGNKTQIRTVIREDVIKLAQYLRGDQTDFKPTII